MTEVVTGTLLDGAALIEIMNRATTEQAASLAGQGINPTLAVVHAGEWPAARSYRRQICRQAGRLGIAVQTISLSEETTPPNLDTTLTALNNDRTVHGVLVQTPLSAALRRVVLFRLSSDKDPEGATPRHLGMLSLGESEVLPCTPAAIVAMIKSWQPDLTGANVVVVNGGPVIGRPLATMLVDEHATPTICTEYTRNLAIHTRQADVLVTAAGRPGLIGPDHVRAGALVIDAAINRLADGTLVGDVDTTAVLDRAAAVTPVPGGVGPVTTAVLLSNVVKLAALHRGGTRDYS